MDKQKIIKLVDCQDFKTAKELILQESDNIKNDTEMQKLLGLCNINLGCTEEALENFSFLLNKNPNDALSLYYLAAIYIEKEDFIQAETLLKKVIDLRQDYLDAYKSLCIVYIKQNKYTDIIELEDKMLQINAKDPQIYDILSSASLDAGKFDAAIEYMNKAAEIVPDSPKYLNKLGLAYFSQGNIQKALEYYSKSLSIDNHNPSALYNQGLAYFSLEDFEKAASFLKQAYDTDNKIQYLTAYALACLKAQQYKEAISAYKLLIENSPDKENFQYNLACAYDGNNEPDKAIKIIEKLLTFNLNLVQLKLHLASLYSRKKRIQAAKILYADLISSGITNINVLYEYAVLCAKTNDTDKSEEILKKIISMDPSFFLAYKDLAIIYLSRRFFDQSLDYFKKAYKLAPDNKYVIFEFANYFHLMADFEQAKKMYAKLLKQEDIPDYMLINISVNYISMNMMNKAKEILLKLIKQEPQNIQVLFHLAQVYYSEKNYENARQLLEDAYAIAANTEIANLLAKVYMNQHEYNSAYALLSLINLAMPNNIAILYDMAYCSYLQKNYQQAKENIDLILKILPEHEEAKQLLNKIEEEELK